MSQGDILKALEASKNLALIALKKALEEGDDSDAAINASKTISYSAAFINIPPDSVADLISFHNDLNGTLAAANIVGIAIAPSWGSSNAGKIKEIKYYTIKGHPILNVKYDDGRELSIGFSTYTYTFNEQARAGILIIRVEPTNWGEEEEEPEGEEEESEEEEESKESKGKSKKSKRNNEGQL